MKKLFNAVIFALIIPLYVLAGFAITHLPGILILIAGMLIGLLISKELDNLLKSD